MKEITLKEFDGYKYIDGGVCAAKGFRANGVYCGIKESKTKKNDLGLIVSDIECNTAAVYTTNKVKGSPIIVTKANLEKTENKCIGCIVNSKNANTCNADGEQKAYEMCKLAAEKIGTAPEKIAVASTGVIGQVLPIEPIKNAIDDLYAGLSYDGNEKAAVSIMTTDTVKKEVAVEFTIGGKVCHMGGMAKGSGMIHPNMATTLNFITTDCAITDKMAQVALSGIVKITYNCLSVDGDTSTNDMVLLMSNGMAGNKQISFDCDDYEIFMKALYIVMMNLTKMLAKDGEGATKLLECNVSGAKNLDTAIEVAKSVIGSNLLKCAMFGADANWGRVLCAVGYADADLDIHKVAVSMSSKAGKIDVCENGAGIEFSEEQAKKILSEDEISIDISLGDGKSAATAWGCDLTYDYVHINGDYRS